MEDLTYDQKIIICFNELCKKQGDTSPTEVTNEMF